MSFRVTCALAGAVTVLWVAGGRVASQSAAVTYPVVFVSRALQPGGSIYWNAPLDLPGVGPHSRFRVAAPGLLQIREVNGAIRTLVNGAAPTAASLNLIDVNAPDVSYDGQRLVFAGLPAGNYSTGTLGNPSAWRIYSINVDGTNLRQVTVNEDRTGVPSGLIAYDDGDPAWLPDGRIVFSSTRWPSFAHYSGVRTSNLYVINADGTNLHRITAERNGADRPLVDPITGKIVFARWWRNHRFALNSMATVADPNGGYRSKDGLSADRNNEIDGSSSYNDYLWRNAWQAATINPDGTGLALFGGSTYRTDLSSSDDTNHMYGGGFSPTGELYANYFPMLNMTEAGGFGGIRRFTRGARMYTPITGITTLSMNYANPNPPSFGIFVGSYATDPDVLPDGRVIVSWAPDVNQDYGLYVMNADGSGRTPVYDVPGRTEVRARVVRPRPLPPMQTDSVTQVASRLPPSAQGPYNIDGTFVFDALNVYFNAPVDSDIVSAPGVGTAATMKFFIDHQRSSPGSFPNLDWPILLAELPIGANGAVRNIATPANVPLFEQIRSANGLVPLNGGAYPNGAAHVAGLNYGRPGTTSRCVGCHAGHTLIPVPSSPLDAQWTNLAPGAQVTVSSSRDPSYNRGLVDRRAAKGEIWRAWTSASGQYQNQWARLTFPVPIKVRIVRPYNPRQGDEANSTLQVPSATVRLFADAAATQQVAVRSVGALNVGGTDVPFPDVKAQVVQVDLGAVTGTFYGARVASLAEIEVIGNADGDAATDTDQDGMPDDWEVRFGLNPAVNDASGDPDGDGVSNLEEYVNGTNPRGFYKRYFAEGASGSFFSTRVALLNLNAVTANVTLRYQRSDSYAASRFVQVGPRSRYTDDPSTTPGFDAAEFASFIESDQPIVVDRTMRWGAGGYGSHTETALTGTATTWYLAEGATHSGFNLFYLLQNPGTSSANVEVKYLRPTPLPPLVQNYVVGAGSRLTVWVNLADPALASTDVSATIRSTNGVPIIVERSMYLNTGNRLFGAGHDSAGATSPRTSWFFAEGATGPYFDLFLLLANPSATTAQVEARYLLPTGGVIVRTYAVAPNSRFNIWVDQEGAALANTAVSTTITSTNGVPIIAERSMWWPGNLTTWTEAHNAFGSTSTGVTWATADGESGGPNQTETYLLVANTSPFAATVRVTLFFENGITQERTYGIAANSRFNVPVGTDFSQARDRQYGVLIESLGSPAAQIVVERASYSDANGVHWAAGGDTLAARLQ